MYAMQMLVEQTWEQVSPGFSVCSIACSFEWVRHGSLGLYYNFTVCNVSLHTKWD